MLRSGGLWTLPVNGAVYRVDKTNKTLALILGPKDDIFDKNVLTFAEIGYQVTDERIKRHLAADGSEVLPGMATRQSVSPDGAASLGA